MCSGEAVLGHPPDCKFGLWVGLECIPPVMVLATCHHSQLSIAPDFKAPIAAGQIGLAVLQSVILIFGYWIRSTAIWTMLGLMGFAALIAGYALWRREPKQLVRNWPFAVLVILAAGHLVYAALMLHPVFESRNERPHHVLWHALFFGIAIHPDWLTSMRRNSKPAIMCRTC
jgi:hypothetical protein